MYTASIVLLHLPSNLRHSSIVLVEPVSQCDWPSNCLSSIQKEYFTLFLCIAASGPVVISIGPKFSSGGDTDSPTVTCLAVHGILHNPGFDGQFMARSMTHFFLHALPRLGLVAKWEMCGHFTAGDQADGNPSLEVERGWDPSPPVSALAKRGPISLVRPTAASSDTSRWHEVLLFNHDIRIQSINQLRIVRPEALHDAPRLERHEVAVEVRIDLRIAISLAHNEFAIECASDAAGAGQKAEDVCSIVLGAVLDEVLAHLRPKNQIQRRRMRFEDLQRSWPEMLGDAIERLR